MGSPQRGHAGTAHSSRLGERLRRVRQQQQLSLQDVEEQSGGALKASVVGAYERGERAISMSRLQTLADFYKVPVVDLLPEARPPPEPRSGASRAYGVVIDLTRLEQHTEAEPAVTRYVRSIQHRRGDYNGRVLTVRGSDLDLLAAVLDVSREELRGRLASAGLMA